MSAFKLTSGVVIIGALLGFFAGFVSSDIDCYQCGLFEMRWNPDYNQCHNPPLKTLRRFKDDGWLRYTGCEIIVFPNGGILRGPVNTFPLTEHCVQTASGIKRFVCVTNGCNHHRVFRCSKKDGSRGKLISIRDFPKGLDTLNDYNETIQ